MGASGGPPNMRNADIAIDSAAAFVEVRSRKTSCSAEDWYGLMCRTSLRFPRDEAGAEGLGQTFERRSCRRCGRARAEPA